MFEAYSRNKYTSTGVIQWMLNNAWPSLLWHLYDYNLEPAGGYFGTKKANEPIHILYSYDDRSIVVVNSTYRRVSGMSAPVRVVDFDLRERFSQEMAVDVDVDGVSKLLQVPIVPSDVSPTVYFIQLELRDAGGKIVSSNFYWLPTKKSEFDWEKTVQSISTPIASYEDMTRVESLPKMHLTATAYLRQANNGKSIQVRLKNSSIVLAFQVHLTVEAGNPVKRYSRCFGTIITCPCCPARNELSRPGSPGSATWLATEAEDYGLEHRAGDFGNPMIADSR